MKKRNDRGYVLLSLIVFMALFISASATLLNYVTQAARNERSAIASAQALALAEAGIDKAAYELNQSAGYSGESDTSLGNGTFSVSVASINSNTKRVTVTGSVPNRRPSA
jgi:type II secretory pathway component PulK